MITLENILTNEKSEIIDGLLSHKVQVQYYPEGETTTEHLADGTDIVTILYDAKPVILSATRDDYELTYDELVTIANDINYDVVPELFCGFLTTELKEALREWCTMTTDAKLDKLGSTSFCRFIITILTGSDPITLPYVKDVNGVITGFVFNFIDTEDEKYFRSELLDPRMGQAMQPEEVTQVPEDENTVIQKIIESLIGWFRKNGVVLSKPDNFEGDLVDFNYDTIMRDPYMFNELVNLAADLPANLGETLEDRVQVIYYGICTAVEQLGELAESRELSQYVEQMLNKE